MHPSGIFNSPNQSSRRQLRQRDLARIFPPGSTPGETYLYNKHGYIVDTHHPIPTQDPRPYGALIKAEGLDFAFYQMSSAARNFEFNDDTEDEPEPDPYLTHPIPFYFYPQAGLRNVGHFQAGGLFNDCYPIVGRLNKAIHLANIAHSNAHHDHDSDMDVDIDECEIAFCTSHNIEALSSQGYNSVMHDTRGRSAQHHNVQLGLVTGALAGQWATTPGTNVASHANNLMCCCQDEMPHEAYCLKIESREVGRDLCMENVYCLDLHALHPSRRTGQYVLSFLFMFRCLIIIFCMSSAVLLLKKSSRLSGCGTMQILEGFYKIRFTSFNHL